MYLTFTENLGEIHWIHIIGDLEGGSLESIVRVSLNSVFFLQSILDLPTDKKLTKRVVE